MAVFYNKERGKLGSLSGTIISFSRQLLSNDPVDSDNKKILPAGYLRCDGSVLFATEYPVLAEVLGTGGECKFKKETQFLENNQFQLPDLRNKHIRATSSANIGLYNDLLVRDADGNDIPKSGVGMDVVQNIESPFELTYTGDFYIPPQTVEMRGEPSFTVDTGSYTYETEVPARAFQPHMHRTSTTRVRQFDLNGNHFSSRQRNSRLAKSTLNVCKWWENTRQILCYWQITTAAAKGGPGENAQNSGSYEQYGLCWNACANFTTQGLCLWPDDSTCPEVINEEWNVRQDNDDCNLGGLRNGNNTTFGNITYTPTWTVVCKCDLILGVCVDGPRGQDTNFPESEDLTNYTEINLPFSPADDDSYTTGYAAVSNYTILSGLQGDAAIHRHRLNFNADTPHSFEMKTRAGNARADSGLDSQIVIKRNTEPKADKYIQPYIVTEYLIKI